MKRSAPESNIAGPSNQGNQKRRNTGLNAFEDILEDTQKRSEEEISATVQYKHLKNCLSSVQNNVSHLEKSIDENNQFVVELEARFGTITKKGHNTSFTPALQLAEYVFII